MRELSMQEMASVAGGWGSYSYSRTRTSCQPKPVCQPKPPCGTVPETGGGTSD